MRVRNLDRETYWLVSVIRVVDDLRFRILVEASC